MLRFVESHGGLNESWGRRGHCWITVCVFRFKDKDTVKANNLNLPPVHSLFFFPSLFFFFFPFRRWLTNSRRRYPLLWEVRTMPPLTPSITTNSSVFPLKMSCVCVFFLQISWQECCLSWGLGSNGSLFLKLPPMWLVSARSQSLQQQMVRILKWNIQSTVLESVTFGMKSWKA